jgi:hypothetical protein
LALSHLLDILLITFVHFFCSPTSSTNNNGADRADDANSSSTISYSDDSNKQRTTTSTKHQETGVSNMIVSLNRPSTSSLLHRSYYPGNINSVNEVITVTSKHNKEKIGAAAVQKDNTATPIDIANDSFNGDDNSNDYNNIDNNVKIQSLPLLLNEIELVNSINQEEMDNHCNDLSMTTSIETI